MVESLVESLVGFFSGTLPKELIVFFISVVPVLELRGSILAAGFLQMDFLPTFIISVIGNMLPIPFILLFIDKISYESSSDQRQSQTKGKYRIGSGTDGRSIRGPGY